MKPSHNMEDLLKIMEALRNRKTGCPWDIKQDFKSIAPYTIEEAYEVADTIERDAYDELSDELGDLLLQVVFHSQMASELGMFEFGDVVMGISEKMIRRHPHVFGNETAENSEEVKKTWEKIKAEERREKHKQNSELGISEESTRLLDEIPTNLPALTYAAKLQKKAAEVGFDWPSSIHVLDKIFEEIQELRNECDHDKPTHKKKEIEEEFGDILFSIVNLARHLKINPEKALRSSNQKFKRRFNKIEETARQEKKPIGELGLDRMEQVWNREKLSE